MDFPFLKPLQNLNPLILVGVMVGGVGAEFLHPHAYGLQLTPSTFFTTKNGNRFHIHHWVWGLSAFGLYSLKPSSNISINSLIVGTLFGIIGQGVSYSTSHMLLYDAKQFQTLRAE